jgi:hypothetical protein
MSAFALNLGCLVAGLAVPGLGLAVSRRARRWVSRHPLACRVGGLLGLALVTVGATLMEDRLARAGLAAGGLLAGIALWTAALRRTGWGDPLCRKPDWDRFEAEFHAHVERTRRSRPQRGGSASA